MSDILKMSGKTIIGINPPVEDFAFFDLWSKPFGLLCLLQRMRMNGSRVFLLDCLHEGATGRRTFGREKIAGEDIPKPDVFRNVTRIYHRFGMSREAAAERLRSMPRPDAVFLTSIMTYWYGGVKFAIDLVREELPGVPVFLGGIYARLCPKHAARLGADYLVTDNWMPDVPYPAADLYGRPPYGVTMTSFGCPMHCTYCASHILWPKYLRRGTDEVIDEIAYQAKLGAEDFAFYDDALLLDKKRCFYPLCREIIRRWGGRLRLHTPNGLHVREIDAECAELMRGSGFKTIRLSLESIDPEIAGESSGKVARGEYAAAVRNLTAAGYTQRDCETYILAGLPGQSASSVMDTIKFVLDNGGRPKLAEFSPIPGTPAFEEAAARTPEIRTEPLLQNNTVYCTFISREMTPETMQALKDAAHGVKR